MKRVLVVEDGPLNQKLFALHLRDAGYEVDVAPDGATGVEKIMDGSYEIVLMDIQMPVMNGFEAMRAVRAWEKAVGRKSVPILALTAYDSAEEAKSAELAGCTEYLVKPVERGKLLETIAKMEAGSLATAKTEKSARSSSLEDIIPPFLDNVRMNVAAMCAALSQGNLDQLRTSGRMLHTQAATLGFVFLAELGANIERDAVVGAHSACAMSLQKLATALDALDVGE